MLRCQMRSQKEIDMSDVSYVEGFIRENGDLVHSAPRLATEIGNDRRNLFHRIQADSEQRSMRCTPTRLPRRVRESVREFSARYAASRYDAPRQLTT